MCTWSSKKAAASYAAVRISYQVLQATLVDTWASTAAGAYALSENNLYTSDAFYDYLAHLTDDGILSFTRWGLDPPRESLRLLSLARVALARLGENEPWRNVIVVREGKLSDAGGWGAADTVLISRKPFSAEDLARARDAIRRSGFQTIYLPDESIANPFTELLRTRDIAAFEQSYPYNIRPVTDDRPFFFYTVQARDLWGYLGHFLHSDQPATNRADFEVNMAVPVMFGLLAISLIAVAVILALPPLLLGARLPRDRAPADVPALLRLHRRRLHPDRDRADPEIRPVPGAPDLRAHGHHLLDDDCQRLWQFHEPPAGGALGFPPGRRDGRGGGRRGIAGAGGGAGDRSRAWAGPAG